MFGASVSELYLLIKLLSERTVDLCVSNDNVLPIDERPQAEWSQTRELKTGCMPCISSSPATVAMRCPSL